MRTGVAVMRVIYFYFARFFNRLSRKMGEMAIKKKEKEKKASSRVSLRRRRPRRRVRLPISFHLTRLRMLSA